MPVQVPSSLTQSLPFLITIRQPPPSLPSSDHLYHICQINSAIVPFSSSSPTSLRYPPRTTPTFACRNDLVRQPPLVLLNFAQPGTVPYSRLLSGLDRFHIVHWLFYTAGIRRRILESLLWIVFIFASSHPRLLASSDTKSRTLLSLINYFFNFIRSRHRPHINGLTLTLASYLETTPVQGTVPPEH